MIEYINSPMFGKVAKADDEERRVINTSVHDFPIDVFQTLNYELNERGWQIRLTRLEAPVT